MSLAPPDLRPEGPGGKTAPDWREERSIALGGLLRLDHPPLTRRERKRINRMLAGVSPEERREFRRQLLGEGTQIPSVSVEVPEHLQMPSVTLPVVVTEQVEIHATTGEAGLEDRTRANLAAAIHVSVLAELGLLATEPAGMKRGHRDKEKKKEKQAPVRFAEQIVFDEGYLVLADTDEINLQSGTSQSGNAAKKSADPKVGLKKESLPRSLVTVVAWVIVGAGIALAALMAAPPLMGHKTMVVLSGSMLPTLDIGDVVIDQNISVMDVKIGDVITFGDPNNKKKTVTHRVKSMKVEGRNATFFTQGDANNSGETWNIRTDGKIGRVVLRIPKLGYVFGWAWSPMVRVGFIALPMLFFAGLEIAAIWRIPDDPEPQKKRKGKGKAKTSRR